MEGNKGVDGRTAREHVLAVVVAGFSMRVIYHVAYRPWWAGDSDGYAGPFLQWLSGHFSDGARTPMYPLFLGFAQWLVHARFSDRLSTHSAYAVVILQSILGLGAAVLIYHTMRMLGVREPRAFLTALFFALIPGVCQVELVILTESLSLFSLVLSCFLFVRTMRKLQDRENPLSSAILTGVSFGVAILVRAENLVFFVSLFGITLLLLWRAYGNPLHVRAAGAVLLALPLSVAPIVLAWMFCNYLGVGEFRLTTITGYQVNQSVYNLFDRVEPQDRVLGEIMTRYYRLYNQGGRIVTDYMWFGFNDLAAHSSEMPIKHNARADAPNGALIDLGDYIEHVSLNLILRYPSRWLSNAADTFVRDTFDFNYPQTAPVSKINASSDPQSVDGRNVVRNKGPWRFAVWANRVQAPILFALYIVTLGWALLGPIGLLKKGSTGPALMDGAVIAMATGTLGTFVAFCVVESFHNQYSEPYLGVLVVCSGFAVEKLLTFIEARRKDHEHVAVASA